MSKSPIEWTEQTWNPVRGCSRVSPGCVNCYAERMAARGLPGHRSPTTGEPFAIRTPSGPRWTGTVELIPHMLDVPLKRKTPTTWFVNSMSDLFHEGLSFEDIDRVFAVMSQAKEHTFQILTKRADRMRQWASRPDIEDLIDNGAAANFMCHANIQEWPLPNVWLGTSVEDQQRADERIPHLLQTPAAVRFLSVEPLLGPVGIRPHLEWSATGGIDWVIVGGESGPGARPCEVAWIRSVVQQCKSAGVPVFVKQLGAHVIQGGGRRIKKDKKGGDMHEWEHDLRVREYPALLETPRA